MGAARFLPDDEFKRLFVKLFAGDENITLTEDGKYFFETLSAFVDEKEAKHRARMANLKQNQHTHPSSNEPNKSIIDGIELKYK